MSDHHAAAGEVADDRLDESRAESTPNQTSQRRGVLATAWSAVTAVVGGIMGLLPHLLLPKLPHLWRKLAWLLKLPGLSPQATSPDHRYHWRSMKNPASCESRVFYSMCTECRPVSPASKKLKPEH